VRPCRRSSVRGTPVRIPWPTTPWPTKSPSSTAPSPNCPVTSLVATTQTTIPTWLSIPPLAGFTEEFLAACRARNVGFCVSARSNAQLTAAIFDAIGIEDVWLPALAQDGAMKDGAAVDELTSLIDATKFPSGTRLERPA